MIMLRSFSRTISLLRREKGISQRAVSAELGISQALLSHYENGQREPGLSFVVTVAGYYGVSSDYLLGRTMSRDGEKLDLPDVSEIHDNTLRGSVMGAIQKKLVINSISILFDLVDKTKNRALMGEISTFFGIGIYRMFRCIYHFGGVNPAALFEAPENRYNALCDVEQALCEVHLGDAVNSADGEAVTITANGLKKDYPVLFQSLITLLHNVDEKLSSIG